MSSDLAAFEALENRLGELERRVHGNQMKKNEDMIIVPKLTGKDFILGHINLNIMIFSFQNCIHYTPYFLNQYLPLKSFFPFFQNMDKIST